MDSAVALTAGADPAREELLGTAVEALQRLAPDLPPDAATFLRELHAGLPTPTPR